MALTTTREFRWDDPGAPVLNGTVGSFLELMKACLVGDINGVAYGSGGDARLAAGWTLEFEDVPGRKAVFRNSQAHGGSGCYLRVLDDGSSAGGARVARIDVYEEMTDIDTGTAPAGGGWVWKAQLATATRNAWTLHADERTFYFTDFVGGDVVSDDTSNNKAARRCTVAGGDFSPVFAGDPGCFCAWFETENPAQGATSSGVSGIMRGAVFQVARGFSTSRDASLLEIQTPAAILIPGRASSPAYGFGGEYAALPNMGAVAFFVPAILVQDGSLRGLLRGLFGPLNRWDSGQADVGTVHAPTAVSRPHSLAALAGAAATAVSGMGRLFVERQLSWDETHA